MGFYSNRACLSLDSEAKTDAEITQLADSLAQADGTWSPVGLVAEDSQADET